MRKYLEPVLSIVPGLVGIFLGLAGIFFIFALLFFQDYGEARIKAIDEQTGCPKESVDKVWGIKEVEIPVIKKHIAYAIDATDELDSTQQSAIKSQVEESISNLDKWDMVKFHSIDERDSVKVLGFHRCVPPSGRNANEWFECPKCEQKKFKEKFLKVVGDNVEKLASKKSSSHTPLIEAIEYLVDEYDRVELFTDMMHNTKEWSLYSSKSYQAFKSTKYARSLRSKRRAGTVTVWIILRDTLSEHQTFARDEFWRNYFEDIDVEFEIKSLRSGSGG